MAKKKWYYGCLRNPRTTQERRANQERNNPLIRGRRRKLPNAWDDIPRSSDQKSWKVLGRKHQYRDEKKGYSLHEFTYSWCDVESRMITRNIMRHLDQIGCWYEYAFEGIKWFGPADSW